MTALYFLVAALGFSFVILIHELGHYVFAKWAGVKVDIFSLGFGTRLVGIKVGETDYRISALPFGGYVHMLGQEDTIAQPERTKDVDPRSFLAKHPGWRALILLGGVLFNLVSSYLILLGLAFYGMPVRRPAVAAVGHIPNGNSAIASPADRLGLRVGDTILAIDGAPVREWDDVITTAMVEHDRPLTLTVRRRVGADLLAPDPVFQTIELPQPTPSVALTATAAAPTPITPVYNPEFGRSVLGIEAYPEGNRIGALSPGSDPALPQIGERVVAIAGRDLPTDAPGTPVAQKRELLGQEITVALEPWLGRSVQLTLERDGKRRTAEVVYGGDSGDPVGFPVMINRVEEDMPAAAAGIVPGDVLLAINGTPVVQCTQCLRLIKDGIASGQPLHVSVWHDGARRDLDLTSKEKDGWQRIGIGPAAVVSGTLPCLPTLGDGSPGPLAKVGLAAGDAVVAYQLDATAAAADDGKFHLAQLTGGTVETVPFDKAALDAFQNAKPSHWLSRKHDANPFDAVVGRQVVVIDKTNGEVRLHDAAGNDAKVPLKPLLALMPRFADDVHNDDWITGRHGGPGGVEVLELRRGAGAPKAVTIDPGTVIAFDPEEVPYVISGPGEAFAMVDDAAYNMVVKTFQLLPRFFRSAQNGGIDANKSLTGPIGMFTQLKVRVEHFGFTSFLKFVALIGLNLFLVNLLPIPITDGGHLTFLGFEVVMRRPVPAFIQITAMYIGLIFVVGMMLYVMGLDVMRLVGLG
jgi:membrane-associated protease RseP (regulator of RpoE activity)